MRLDIKNSSGHPDAPVKQMYDAIGVQLYHFCNRWPGAWKVVAELQLQGFYIELKDGLPEAPGAAGYHGVDNDGRPFSPVDVNASLENGSDWITGPYSVVSIVGHEALETVGDPLCNTWVDVNQAFQTAKEMCDAVEATGYHHRGMDLTNFLLPSWFNPFGKRPFDYLGQLEKPFSMTPGGYMLLNVGGSVQQKFAEDVPEWRKHVQRTRAVLRGRM